MNFIISRKLYRTYIYFRVLKAAFHTECNVTDLCQVKLRLKNSVIENVATGLTAGAKTSYAERS